MEASSALFVIAIFAGILATVHVLGLVFVIFALLQIRRSAQAVEVLAYQAQEELARIKDTSESVRDFAGALGSGWMKLLTMGAGALAAYFAGSRNGREKAQTAGT